MPGSVSSVGLCPVGNGLGCFSLEFWLDYYYYYYLNFILFYFIDIICYHSYLLLFIIVTSTSHISLGTEISFSDYSRFK